MSGQDDQLVGQRLSFYPDDWLIDRIKDKTALVVGGDWGNDPDSDAEGIDTIVLRVADLDGMKFSFNDLTVRKIKHSSLKTRKINNRSLLLEKSGGGEKQTVGRAGAPTGLIAEAICSNFMAKIDFDESVDLSFMNYVFSDLYACQLNSPHVQQTTGIQNLNVTHYLTTSVGYPPKAEQTRIAQYLDQTCAVIDRAIAVKQQQLETLDQLRKSIIYRAVTKGLDDSVEMRDSGVEWIGECPCHWRIERIKRGASRIQTGVTPPTDRTDYYVDGDVPWFAPASFSEEIRIGEPVKLVNRLAYADGKLRMYPNGSVFWVGIGATIGKVAVIEREASCNQQVMGIECRHDLLPTYLCYFLKILEKEIPKIAQYTTLPIMDQAKFGYLHLTMPPMREQVKISAKLDAEMAKISQLSEKLNQQIAGLAEYKKSLIHECVTGKRRITEADLKEVA